MDDRTGHAEKILRCRGVRHESNILTDEVEHHGGTEQPDLSERQATQGPHLLLKLRDRTGIQGVVTGVMRPGGDFVDHQPAIGHEEQFHAKYPHPVKRLHGVARDGAGQVGNRLRHIGRHDRLTENALFMDIVHQGVGLRRAVGTPHNQNR